MALNWKQEIKRSGNLLWLLVLRDLRVRYRGSLLGYLWSMMNPLLFMAVLSFVFSHLMRFKSIENFSAFLLSGILVWNLFGQSVGAGVNSIVANGALLRKVKVPIMVFPAAVVGSVFINFCLALIPYFFLAMWGGVKPTIWLLSLPFLLLPFVVFTYGITVFVASLNVRFRDVGHVMEPALQILFYATPIVYPLSILPEKYHVFAWLNPITPFVTNARAVLYEGGAPAFGSVAVTYGLAVVALMLGASVYRKMRYTFVYHV